MKLRCLAAAATAALLLSFAPTSVLAAGVADAPIDEHDRAAVSLAFTGTTAPPNTAALIPTVAAALRTAPLLLTLDAATSFTSYRFPQQARGSVQRFANPVLGAQLSLFNRPELVLRTGLVAGAPLLTVPGGITNNVAAEHADRVAAAATGQRSYWMWARNVVPLAAFVRSTARFVDPLEFPHRRRAWRSPLGQQEPFVSRVDRICPRGAALRTRQRRRALDDTRDLAPPRHARLRAEYAGSVRAVRPGALLRLGRCGRRNRRARGSRSGERTRLGRHSRWRHSIRRLALSSRCERKRGQSLARTEVQTITHFGTWRSLQ